MDGANDAAASLGNSSTVTLDPADVYRKALMDIGDSLRHQHRGLSESPLFLADTRRGVGFMRSYKHISLSAEAKARIARRQRLESKRLKSKVERDKHLAERWSQNRRRCDEDQRRLEED